MGVVLWEIYTAAEPGYRSETGELKTLGRLEHIRAVCVDNRRPALPSEDVSTVAAGRASLVVQSCAAEYESWVRMCWDASPGSRPKAEEVLSGLEYVADSVTDVSV